MSVLETEVFALRINYGTAYISSSRARIKGFEGVNWRETARVRRHRHATGCLTACLIATGPKLLRNGQKLIGQDRGGWRLHENYCPLRLQYALF